MRAGESSILTMLENTVALHTVAVCEDRINVYTSKNLIIKSVYVVEERGEVEVCVLQMV